MLALDGLDLAVPRGEVFGVLGPNGAGKSTTIRLLLNLARATAGRASILRVDTGDVGRRTGCWRTCPLTSPCGRC